MPAAISLDGYNTVDFIGSYALPVGKLTFSIENLLNEDYVTVWGQRAVALQPDLWQQFFIRV